MHRLPYEWFPDAPKYQVNLAVAELLLEAEDAAKVRAEATRDARRPTKMRRAHARIGKALRALT